MEVLQKGDSFQGPRLNSGRTLRKELSKGARGVTHVLTKEETFWEGAPGWVQEKSSRVRETRRTATWLTVSGFMEIGLVSALSLVNHSDS